MIVCMIMISNMVMMLTMNIILMMMKIMMILFIDLLMRVMRVITMMMMNNTINITLIILLMFLMVMPVKSKPVQQGCPRVDRPMMFKRVLKYGSKWSWNRSQTQQSLGLNFWSTYHTHRLISLKILIGNQHETLELLYASRKLFGVPKQCQMKRKKKDPAYGRHQISRPMQLVAPPPRSF